MDQSPQVSSTQASPQAKRQLWASSSSSSSSSPLLGGPQPSTYQLPMLNSPTTRPPLLYPSPGTPTARAFLTAQRPPGISTHLPIDPLLYSLLAPARPFTPSPVDNNNNNNNKISPVFQPLNTTTTRHSSPPLVMPVHKLYFSSLQHFGRHINTPLGQRARVHSTTVAIVPHTYFSTGSTFVDLPPQHFFAAVICDSTIHTPGMCALVKGQNSPADMNLCAIIINKSRSLHISIPPHCDLSSFIDNPLIKCVTGNIKTDCLPLPVLSPAK